MIVVADTTPLNYLVLIQTADVLPRLFGEVLIPPAVLAELKDPETPPPVRAWLATPPSWLRVQALRSRPDPQLGHLDAGEREAITLAEELKSRSAPCRRNRGSQGGGPAQTTISWNAWRSAQSRAARTDRAAVGASQTGANLLLY